MSRTLQDSLNLYYEIRLQSKRFVDLKDFSLHDLAIKLRAKPCINKSKEQKGVMVFFIFSSVTGNWLDLASFCQKYDTTPGQIDQQTLEQQGFSLEHIFFKAAPVMVIMAYLNTLNTYNLYEQEVEDYIDLTNMEHSNGETLFAI